MIDQNLLSDFADNFFGYGNPEAKTWFIGMEEGGGNTVEDIQNRLFDWDSRGKRPLEDVAEYHEDIGIPELFRFPKTRAQRTWTKLIEIMLVSNKCQSKIQDIRHYQAHAWGRKNGETCLLELMPLPSPNVNTWHYGDFTTDERFSLRKLYYSAYRKFSIGRIRQFIDDHEPETVVFYGLTYEKNWLEISGQRWTKDDELKCNISSRGRTKFFSIPHPAARHAAADPFKFSNIGLRISEQRGLAKVN